jgi:hypothetical protein
MIYDIKHYKTNKKKMKDEDKIIILTSLITFLSITIFLILGV